MSRRAVRGLLTAAGAALLLGGPAAAAHAEDSPDVETRGAAFSLIDNSHADSWLEVDRTLNQELGPGTAGSDHDGAEVRVTGSPGSDAATPAAPEVSE